MKLFAALSVIVLATSASATTSSVFTTPLTKLQRTAVHPKEVPDVDRARARHLKSRTAGGPVTVPATNLPYVQYTTRVGIGSPPTHYSLAVDTGSSSTWCGAGTPYVRSSTSIFTGEAVFVSYGVGYFAGVESLDQVTLAPNLIISNQSVGNAEHSSSFEGVDGILGVGPTDLTNGTLLLNLNATIPTVMDNLVSQGLIKNKVLGVHFAPSANSSDTNGALTYGGADPSLYEGELTYVPVTKTHPAAAYWGINVTSATYGTHTIIPTSTAGVVDTGTTLILLADDYFNAYLSAIPGAQFDPVTTLIEIPASSISSMQPLNFTIGDRVFSLDVAAQLIPTDENTAIGGDPGKHYGVISNTKTTSGGGLDFILGQRFLERYYAVFDSDANRVGFAQTNYTFTTYQG